MPMDTSDFQSSLDGASLQTAYQTLDNHEQEKVTRASSKPIVDATNGTKENKDLNPSLIHVTDPNHVLGLTTEDVQTITDDVKNCRGEETNVQCYTTTLSQPFEMKQSQPKSLFASTYSTNSERRVFVLHLIGNRSENTELFMTTLGNNSEISVSNSSKEDQMDETENRGTPDSRTELQKESLSSSHEPLNANLDGLLSNQATDSVPEDSYSQEAAELFHPSTEGSTVTDGDVQNESFVDETLSVEEYECIVVEGSPVTLEIDVTGFPEPTLTWYKNGQKLTTDQHFKISNKEGKHILFIDKVSDKDAGIYVVRAKNSNGTVSSNAILQVQGNKERPGGFQQRKRENEREIARVNTPDITTHFLVDMHKAALAKVGPHSVTE
ncbi:hypothetical protein scyTo_0000750 [Scyliorhinus torazame]|uniref:Ig-like domain-containing protein n=1 Tax=Scyliorhinus torazame TaxID=75743 RepID=A0A401P3C4_SCYTO|nr:hypothetical protein [Scyliorhinus torazame]